METRSFNTRDQMFLVPAREKAKERLNAQDPPPPLSRLPKNMSFKGRNPESRTHSFILRCRYTHKGVIDDNPAPTRFQGQRKPTAADENFVSASGAISASPIGHRRRGEGNKSIDFGEVCGGTQVKGCDWGGDNFHLQ